MGSDISSEDPYEIVFRRTLQAQKGGHQLKKKNEIHALESVVTLFRHLGILSGDPERILYPDEENSTSEDIDCIVELNRQRIAIEHSVIEYYPGQLVYANNSFEFMNEINDLVGGILSNDLHYILLIDPYLIIDKRKPEMKKLAIKIQEEFIANIDIIGIEKMHVFFYNNLPVSIFCDSIDGIQNGKVYRAQTSPSVNLEIKTTERVRVFFEKKLPKLIRYRLKGYSTLLVIEDISGRFMTQIDRKMIGLWNWLRCFLFVDYIIIFVSINNQMVVANLWKKKYHWPKFTPMERRFSMKDI